MQCGSDKYFIEFIIVGHTITNYYFKSSCQIFKKKIESRTLFFILPVFVEVIGLGEVANGFFEPGTSQIHSGQVRSDSGKEIFGSGNQVGYIRVGSIMSVN